MKVAFANAILAPIVWIFWTTYVVARLAAQGTTLITRREVSDKASALAGVDQAVVPVRDQALPDNI